MKKSDLETSLIERRVRRGVRWLDQNVADWDQKVSIDKISMTSRYSCILGQVFGDYYFFTEGLCYKPWFATTRGFLRPICSSEEGRGYDNLIVQIWKKELERRTK